MQMKLLMNFLSHVFQDAKGSDFIFDSVQLIYCKYHKVNFRRGVLYIDSSDRIKKEKAKINSKTEDD